MMQRNTQKPLYLLDANVLIALRWDQHVHHAAALKWFSSRKGQGWASCAMTEAAFVRVISQPAFSGNGVTPAMVCELLARSKNDGDYHFLNLDFGMDVVQNACTGGLYGHRQITDAWLLTTAIRYDIKLVTFDAGIPALLASQTERDTFILQLKV